MSKQNSENETLVAWQQQRQRQQHRRCNGGARVAFLGNSIQYYNDCPRFLTNLSNGAISFQDSCLRGGATLVSLWEKGNGMGCKFATKNAEMVVMTTKKKEDQDGKQFVGPVVNYDVGSPTVPDLLRCDNVKAIEFVDSSSVVAARKSDEEAGLPSRRVGSSSDQEVYYSNNNTQWDFVVMNDHTQGPARANSREAHTKVLLEKYLPLILNNHATPIIIETHAYRYPGVNNSADLGNAHEFTGLVREGVQSYVEALLRSKLLPESIRPRLAPVGTAFMYIHDDNHEVWEGLFDPYDHFHPSPSGTFLQGCVLHWTIFGSPPPLPHTEEEIKDLWKDARVMHDVSNGDQEPPLPTVNDVAYLWNVATKICEDMFHEKQ